jgi:hypothetical protein
MTRRGLGGLLKSMRFRATVMILALASIPGGALRAQRHIGGFIGGFSTGTELTRSGGAVVLLPEFGVTSTVEFNRFVSVGTEWRYVQKTTRGLKLDYLETPLLVRIGTAGVDPRSQPFIRLGVAPAVELRCHAQGANGGPETSSPHSRPIVGLGFPRQIPVDLSDEIACLGQRQRKLDFGRLAAIGMSFSNAREVFALELRATMGAWNLSAPSARPFKNRSLTFLISTGTRGF